MAVELVTGLVVTGNCADVAPAATVTLAGRDAIAAFELESATGRPPLGAALERLTVPVDALPPVTVDGATVTAETLAGGGGAVTVSVAVRVVVPCVAVMMTDVEAATALVEMAKLAAVAPPVTVMLPGTEATVAFALERFTTRPPLAAALVSVTVPVAPLPPATLAGLIASADRPGPAGAATAVKRRAVEKGPAAPAELTPRTRQKSSWAGSPVTVACDTLTLAVKVSGAVKLLELSIWMV
jgi:hypothetical protein